MDLGRVQVRYMDPSVKGEGGNAARRSGVEVSHIVSLSLTFVVKWPKKAFIQLTYDFFFCRQA